MIIVDLPKPINCCRCSLRMECYAYKEWLLKSTRLTPPEPIKDSACLIKGEQER